MIWHKTYVNYEMCWKMYFFFAMTSTYKHFHRFVDDNYFCYKKYVHKSFFPNHSTLSFVNNCKKPFISVFFHFSFLSKSILWIVMHGVMKINNKLLLNRCQTMHDKKCTWSNLLDVRSRCISRLQTLVLCLSFFLLADNLRWIKKSELQTFKSSLSSTILHNAKEERNNLKITIANFKHHSLKLSMWNNIYL